jgi:hypothetical protein
MSSIRINEDRQGRRFAFVGDYTLREREDGTVDVLRDIDGDEVVMATGGSWDDALAGVGA